MVVKVMKWRPWPPLSSEKFEAKIVVHQLKGLKLLLDDDGIDKCDVVEEYGKLAIQIKWIGSKGNALSLRKHVRNSFTQEGYLREEDGVVEWNEEFINVCNLIANCKEGSSFYPWEITFNVLNGCKRGQYDKASVLFTGSLNFANLVLKGQQKDIEVNVPLDTSKSNNNGTKTTLCLSVSLVELKNTQESMEIAQGPVVHSSRKVRFLRALSSRKSKKEYLDEDGSDGKSSINTDLPDDLDHEEEEPDEGNISHVKDSLSYETLTRANHAGPLFYSSTSSSEDEDLMYYGNKDSEKCYQVEKSPTSVIKHSSIHGPISSILLWRKRKLSFKPFKEKGEPLLRKDYKDDGGDDIDHDRRLLSSSDESTFKVLQDGEDAMAYRSSVSEFGDDNFAVGNWEEMEIMNRDGNMKLKTNVFFASIDQMSEKADGESACTSLAAVIAEWFHSNTNQMPIKSQFESLIRDGSSEWRHLCENEVHINQFPDKHFDLDTVLESKPRSISLVPEKSFVGFFHPEETQNAGFEFLQGAMSVDNIWEEISNTLGDPVVYIVSWNDHFFVLKVEHDAYYIIDTLGERLFQGCNQAYILKFDQETTLYQEKTVLYRGKEACKEYIKNFLAAIPIRQLEIDVKNGLMDSTLAHLRLQIEFHYTKPEEVGCGGSNQTQAEQSGAL